MKRTTTLAYGQLHYLLNTTNRHVYAYYHPAGMVTFELMPSGPNRTWPWQELLKTSGNGKLHLAWVDFPIVPDARAVRRECRRFLATTV